MGILILPKLSASEDGAAKRAMTFTKRQKVIEPITSASEAFPELSIQEDYLDVNPYSRPAIELTEVQKIVIHYTANPATGAKANRDYFNHLADTGETYASSHFVIDLDGTILQCIPLNEIAYASNEANTYCISIECCHPDDTGEFSTATYNQCVALTAALCDYYQLDTQEDVIRHYDITGKECPLFYVNHPEEWEMFLGFVEAYREQ
jgi:N-acetylmuramoyl-L-alanine amidase CwlA